MFWLFTFRPKLPNAGLVIMIGIGLTSRHEREGDKYSVQRSPCAEIATITYESFNRLNISQYNMKCSNFVVMILII